MTMYQFLIHSPPTLMKYIAIRSNNHNNETTSTTAINLNCNRGSNDANTSNNIRATMPVANANLFDALSIQNQMHEDIPQSSTSRSSALTLALDRINYNRRDATTNNNSNATAAISATDASTNNSNANSADIQRNHSNSLNDDIVEYPLTRLLPPQSAHIQQHQAQQNQSMLMLTSRPPTPLQLEMPPQSQQSQSPPPPYAEWMNQYNSEWERLKSFQCFPYQNEVNVLKMIKDGLYYIGDGISASVRCQFCSIIFDVRKISDLDQHRSKSPHCPLLQNPPLPTSNCSFVTLPLGYDIPERFANAAAVPPNSTLSASYNRTNNQSSTQRIVSTATGRNTREILCFLFIINVFIFLLLATRQFF